MDVSAWGIWIVVVIMLLISIMLLCGKGSFLIAGYNTLPKEKKKTYNEKKLCRVVGSGFFIMTLIFGVTAFYKFELPLLFRWVFPWGYLGIVLLVLILANTICKVKK